MYLKGRLSLVYPFLDFFNILGCVIYIKQGGKINGLCV